MLGLGLGITKTGFINRLPNWLKAYIKRVKADDGTIEAKECVQADGDFLVKNTRGGIIVDAMGKYATTYGGDGLEARDCSAQSVNDLLYDPKPQARFMFLAQDLGTELENYYCVSNSIDDLEGDLAVFGSVTHTYGADISAGEIALSVENGEAPYTYSWSNGATVEDITGLTKGVYNIQVKDANGALASNSFTVRGDADPSIVTAGLRMDSYFTDSALEFPALGSAEFNGTSDYIDAPNDTDITNATFSAWFYGSSTSFSHRTILGSEGFRFQVQGNQHIRFDLKSTSTNQSVYGQGVPLHNQWQFISVTKSGSVYTFYQNGSKIYSPSTPTITPRDMENTSIGQDRYSSIGGPDNMLGNLANVAIWNRALHPDEINAIMWKSYGDLNAVDKNGLQAWYALDDINGTTVPDSTGNHNGTAN